MGVIKHYLKGELNDFIIYNFICKTDKLFIPPLSSILNVKEWSKKLHEFANIITYEENGEILGMIAFYFNKSPLYSYGTFMAVDEICPKEELIGPRLFLEQVKYCQKIGSAGLKFEIRESNRPLFKFYKHLGFKVEGRVFSEKENEYKLHMSKDF